ncbi:MAG: hypothetical protein LBN36_05855 [Clostridiales Family XIII bacterium]|jgi:hypothetical protein|nr:hypothetical protein [Clostridiales Family XIII bacterium]
MKHKIFRGIITTVISLSLVIASVSVAFADPAVVEVTTGAELNAALAARSGIRGEH